MKTHENTFLVNLMFRRLDKFDGPIFGEAYIRDVNWVTYLGGGGERIFGRVYIRRAY